MKRAALAALPAAAFLIAGCAASGHPSATNSRVAATRSAAAAAKHSAGAAAKHSAGAAAKHSAGAAATPSRTGQAPQTLTAWWRQDGGQNAWQRLNRAVGDASTLSVRNLAGDLAVCKGLEGAVAAVRATLPVDVASVQHRLSVALSHLHASSTDCLHGVQNANAAEMNAAVRQLRIGTQALTKATIALSTVPGNG